VNWFDVDQPEVIELRRKLFPDRADYRMIACSVTDPEWLEQIPATVPTLVVAEGLFMYLLPAAGHELFRRPAGHFDSVTVTFDGLSRLGLRVTDRYVTRIVGPGLLHWPLQDPRELELAVPGLRCTAAEPVICAPSTLQLGPLVRFLAAPARRIRPLRNIATYFRYEFGPHQAR
jgi:O-methyltransferase involved in polyketide biosynthesis